MQETPGIRAPPRIKRNQNRRPNQFPGNTAYNSNISDQRAPMKWNTPSNSHSDYNYHPPLSSLSSFMTHDGVTFEAKKNQNFQKAWTE